MPRRLVLALLLLAAGCDSGGDSSNGVANPTLVGRSCRPEATSGGVLEFSEVAPEIVGGLPALQQGLVYPNADRQAGTEGTVVVRFVVGTDGLACDPAIARSLSVGLDRVAFVAVQEVRFTPGRQGGVPVPVRMTVPVRFSLDG